LRTILIVDDDPVSIRTLELIAAGEGYATAAAASAAEAVSWLEGPGSCEMVITDQNMPQMTGLELYSAIRADVRFRHLTFILCTGFADEPTIKEAMRLGIRHFIVKPITSKVVLEKLAIAAAESPQVTESRDLATTLPRLSDPEDKCRVAPGKERLPAPKIAIPIDEARACIAQQIATGSVLLEASVMSLLDLAKARVARREWSVMNRDILTRMFDNRSVATAYGETTLDTVSMSTGMSGKIAEYHHDMRRSIDKLQAIAGIVEALAAEAGSAR
jgi:CheY-like chemotaxis protein